MCRAWQFLCCSCRIADTAELQDSADLFSLRCYSCAVHKISGQYYCTSQRCRCSWLLKDCICATMNSAIGAQSTYGMQESQMCTVTAVTRSSSCSARGHAKQRELMPANRDFASTASPKHLKAVQPQPPAQERPRLSLRNQKGTSGTTSRGLDRRRGATGNRPALNKPKARMADSVLPHRVQLIVRQRPCAPDIVVLNALIEVVPTSIYSAHCN